MFVDTTVLIEILGRPATDPFAKLLMDRLEGEPMYCSAIQFGELADFYRRRGLDFTEPDRKLRQVVQVVAVDEDTAVAASHLKAEARTHRAARDFSFIDGIVLASARRRNQRVLTTAKEFSPFTDAIVERPDARR